MSFTHLHNHSDNSFLDGMCRVQGMVDWAKENSAPAIAITDHGNMFGVYDFYKYATEVGVKPIIGCEVYVAPGKSTDKDKNQISPYHLTLLAENNTGYYNLLKLVSDGYLHGFYRKPRIDMDMLAAYSEGIIMLTGCIQGQIPQLVYNGSNSNAKAYFDRIIDIMPKGNVYVEIQNHEIDKELVIYPKLVQLAEEYDLPLVATNDSHYVNKDDHQAHDIMLCVQTRKNYDDKNRMRFDNQFYLKTMDEMRDALKNYPPVAIDNAFAIAERCNVKIEHLGNTVPTYDAIPDTYTEYTYLKKLCYDGLTEKLGKNGITDAVKQRIDEELDIINQTGYCGYFLTVWDYADYARKQGYPLSARGSAGGSVALYALGVIDFNPMNHGCLFERFLNTERISMPDIDIDFGDEIRDKVIEYVTNKYGKSHVARVATFSKLSARSTINDVGRALEIPTATLQTLSKAMASSNEEPYKVLQKEVPKIKEYAEELRPLIPICSKLDGIKRHVSCHASAIIVSGKPLAKQVPLFKDKNDQVASQFDGDALEKLGMIKFDFLGSKSLMQAHKCVDMIYRNYNTHIELDKIPLDDTKTYKLVNAGLLEGIFQLEGSAGIMSIASDISPSNFEEFLTITALFRPGPLQSGLAKQYIECKNGRQEVEYLHDLAQDTLQETYGVPIYQEQVMGIAQSLAGFTLGEADILRSAMGKANVELMSAQKDKFVDGAVGNGVDRSQAVSIFEKLESFGKYCFNKSHTVAYSLLSYRMAYMKAYYPREFMACVMTREANNETKMLLYIKECRRLETHLNITIELLSPHINHSSEAFTVEGEAIRFGLGCVKHVNTQTIQAIEEARKDSPFESFEDFCKRMPAKLITKKTLESLIKSGAVDGLTANRATLLENVESFITISKKERDKHDTGQIDLFAFGNIEPIETKATDIKECKNWDLITQRQHEKEVMGFSNSAHPLDAYRKQLSHYVSESIENLHTVCKEDDAVIVAGIIGNRKERKTRRGQPMITFDIEGVMEKIDATAFPKDNSVKVPANGSLVLVEGIAKQPTNWDSGKYKLTVSKVTTIDNIDTLTTDIEIKVPTEYNRDREVLTRLMSILKAYPGNKNVLLNMQSEKNGDVVLQCNEKYNVEATTEMIEEVNKLFGANTAYTSNKTARLQLNS